MELFLSLFPVNAEVLMGSQAHWTLDEVQAFINMMGKNLHVEVLKLLMCCSLVSLR